MLLRRAFAIAVLCSPVCFAGCGTNFFNSNNAPTGDCANFFHDASACSTGTGTGMGTSATNYAFVANLGANSVAGLGISSSGLAALTGSPITFAVAPTALVVAHGNNFLYVGNTSQIFGFAISSTGAITALNSGSAIANANCADMQVTSDGKWLMVLDATGVSIDLFGINSDGTLAANSGIGFQTTQTPIANALRINPAGTVVAAAMGTAGELLFSFNTSTGAFAQLSQTAPPNSSTSDTAAAWDGTGNYLFVTRTGTSAGLVVNQVAANGALTPTTSAVYATGTKPTSVVVDNTSKYVYVANQGDSTVSGYVIGTSEALTTAPGSPYASGAAVTHLAADSTGQYIAASALNSAPDLTLYSFDANNPGRLYVVGSSATGINAGPLALSH